MGVTSEGTPGTQEGMGVIAHGIWGVRREWELLLFLHGVLGSNGNVLELGETVKTL